MFSLATFWNKQINLQLLSTVIQQQQLASCQQGLKWKLKSKTFVPLMYVCMLQIKQKKIPHQRYTYYQVNTLETLFISYAHTTRWLHLFFFSGVNRRWQQLQWCHLLGWNKTFKKCDLLGSLALYNLCTSLHAIWCLLGKSLSPVCVIYWQMCVLWLTKMCILSRSGGKYKVNPCFFFLTRSIALFPGSHINII